MAAVNELLAAFKPMLEENQISTRASFDTDSAVVFGSVSSVEAIITNFVTNSVNAFRSPAFHGGERIFEVRGTVSGPNIVLRFLDSGPGIVGIAIEDVWLPGQTTTPNGTGLGLTIVRDSVRDLGGGVNALASGELGGAEFIVTLPLVGE